MRVGLIAAAYPPDLDGIGDYTWCLAGTVARQLRNAQASVCETGEKRFRLPEAPPVIVFTRIGMDHRPAKDVEVARFFDPEFPRTFAALTESIATDYSNPGRQIDWIVLQYNPFSWGSRGYCPKVPRTMQRLRQIPDSPRLAVMFHETAVPKWPWRFSVMFAWQYPIFRNVCRLAEVAFVSTMRWTAQVRRAAPKLPVHHLPVGANIPLSEVSQQEARSKLGIDRDALVLGVFGGAHISRRLDWIATVIGETRRRRLHRKTVLLYVGSDSDAMRGAFGTVDLMDCGALPAAMVGARLRAMDAAISPFLDGVSTRRGSVMALLQHGIPLATNQNLLTDEVFRRATPAGILVSSATSSEAFATETVDWLDRLAPGSVPDPEITAYHDLHFSWQSIASMMLKHLPHA